ncbi:MAG: DNA-protecting protein DprA [Nitrospirae bacterium]|nr:MAG: DNA-protecting protein DprA [Nitrospirota bacterium]
MTKKLEHVQAWLQLTAIRGLGPARVRHLVQTFRSPHAVLTASVEDLITHGGLPAPLAHEVTVPLGSETMKRIDRDLQAVARGQYTILTLDDPSYPSRLKTIPDPPPILYMTGQLPDTDMTAIAIVGSRRATSTGRTFIRHLGGELAALGFTIVSGMARGIDAAAHDGALSASGRTIAVLGCGIDQTYPPEHRRLREAIERQGAVLSEFLSGTPPHGYHFPQRNRVISGLSLGVIVAEATIRSGSLITAHHACEQNREVFAVPGSPTHALSRGPHHLIKQGAKLVETVDDVLEEIFPHLPASMQERIATSRDPQQAALPVLEKEEAEVLERIPLEPVTLEAVLSQGSRPLAELMGILLSLEVKGLIAHVPGPRYYRTTLRHGLHTP